MEMADYPIGLYECFGLCLCVFGVLVVEVEPTYRLKLIPACFRIAKKVLFLMSLFPCTGTIAVLLLSGLK
jgi:hypothetical protein